MHSPLEQFRIKTWLPLEWGGWDISLTNASVAMLMTVFSIVSLGVWGLCRTSAGRPGKAQSLWEVIYEWVENIIVENAGPEGRRFLPFVLSMFLLIFFGNMLGMVPYQFTFTSHIIVTFSLAFVVFAFVTGVGFYCHGLKFFSILIPHGTPWALLPLVVPIEIISYFSRPVSLSLRLFANMMAGHTLLKVFATFVVSLGLWGVVPFAFSVVLTGFELMVSALQAYVFTVLTCVYLRDAIALH